MKILFIFLFSFNGCSDSFKKRSIYDLSIFRKIISINELKSELVSTPPVIPPTTPVTPPAIPVTPVTPPVTPNINKYIFVTVSTHNGRFGIDPALASNGAVNGNGNAIEEVDQFCRKDKDLFFTNLPGNSTEYKALITEGNIRRACSTANCSGGNSESIDWVLKPDTIYYRSSVNIDTVLFKTDASVGIFKFISGNTLTNSIDINGANSWWTGFGQDWTTFGSSNGNCSDWLNPGSGTVGVGNSVNATSIDSLNLLNCNTQFKIVCVRQ